MPEQSEFSERDRALLESFRAPCQSHEGFVTDFIGVKTSVKYLAQIRDWSGKTIPGIPIPSDGYHAETIEYLALFTALMESKRERFVCVELGAGWGPWLAAAGVVAQRLDYSRVKLIGVEASKHRFDFMCEHMKTNHLLDEDAKAGAHESKVECVLLEGAVWERDGVVYFPERDAAHDYGPAASSAAAESDYRGQSLGHKGVQAFSLETIFGDSPHVHFLHVDIQGGEAALCHSGIGILNERVAYLFIGTHSRKIEGDLFELFYKNGWQLLGEHPCRFAPTWQNSTLEALTTSDGGQFWMNPKVVPQISHGRDWEAELALSSGAATQTKLTEAEALHKQVKKLEKQVEHEKRKATESKLREAELANALRRHSANPLRALRLWWNRR